MRKAKEKNYNSIVIRALGEKPIAFNPMLARVVDCTVSGLFLSQLLYWWGKGTMRKGWICKTIKEVKWETCLNRSQQDRAIKVWKDLGVLEVEHHMVPRKRFFKIDEVKLIKLLEKVSGKKLVLDDPSEQVKAIQFVDFSTL